MIKITLARSAGFCFGVKRAIEIAAITAIKEKNVFMLGDIVHNADVAAKIRSLGVTKVESLSSGKGKVLLIRAHGAAEDIINRAAGLGYKVVDATCPMVKEIHRIAKKAEANGRKVIVIGDRKHEEVRGIIGQLENPAAIIDPHEKVRWRKFSNIKKACLIAQSTQNTDKVLEIARTLQKYIKDMDFINTVCRPTRIKQAEIKRMPADNDVMIVIGSKKSANTKRLYQISKSLNRRSHWVQSEKDIKREWLKNARSVGVTAGASTPEETIEGVVAYLKDIR